MADLSTDYLGLTLANPLVPSSSPLTRDLAGARRLEDAGAAAIVLPSLFEETILAEQARLDRFLDEQTLGHGEAQSFRPLPTAYRSTEERYLENLVSMKQGLQIPVVASLNGITAGGWLPNALALESAGADAIELNVFYIAGDPLDTAESVEARYVEVVRELVEQVRIPVAVKLSPQFTAPLAMVGKLEAVGAKGVSLFNRFYQPDIDLETLDIAPKLSLSSPVESLLRVRWAAMLYGHTRCSIAVTGGFHCAADAIKALLAGASVVHLCSVLLSEGPAVTAQILAEMQAWLEQKEYDSVRQLRGSLSAQNAPRPADYARANYLDVLQNYEPPAGVRF